MSVNKSSLKICQNWSFTQKLQWRHSLMDGLGFCDDSSTVTVLSLSNKICEDGGEEGRKLSKIA